MIDIDRILEILPHRYPILLVDKVTSLKPFEFVEAYKNITINEPIFLGHFPSKAVYRGVFIIEGMAQAGVILAFCSVYGDKVGEIDDTLVYFMSIDRAKFRSMVRPGDKLEYRLEVLKHKGKVWVLDAKAFVDGKLVAEAELKAMLDDNDDSRVKN